LLITPPLRLFSTVALRVADDAVFFFDYYMPCYAATLIHDSADVYTPIISHVMLLPYVYDCLFRYYADMPPPCYV